MSDPNRRYHNRIAARYDDVYSKDPYWEYYFDVSWLDLKKSIPPDLGRPVLDIGCGTGRYGIRLLKSGYRTVFADIAMRMLERAEKAVASGRTTAKAEFVEADITDLAPFDAETFSLVVGQGDPLSFASDWRKAMRSVRRVLIPGGRAVLSVDSRYGGLDPLLARGDFDGLGSFLQTGQGTWLADQKEERFPFHAFTPEELRSEAERAGFHIAGLIGKTVFDLRGNHPWLQDKERRKQLLLLERRFGSTALALGRAHHLQITLERRDGEVSPSTATPVGTRRRRRGR